MDAIPINLMTSTKDNTDLDCTFGMVMTDFLNHLWNLRITFPNHDIAIHGNDVKSCVRQLKHHPDVMGAFSFVIDMIMFLQCSLTFGLDFSPTNWEPIQLIAEQLAMALSMTTRHRKSSSTTSTNYSGMTALAIARNSNLF